MSVFYPEELIIYSLSFNSFLPFNVEDDVLAKVRRNFFEHNKRQSDKLVQNINNITIKYTYNLEKKKPMKWVVKKDKKVIEQAVVTSVNSYEIRTFDDMGNKILTTEFTNDHIIKKATFSVNGETVVVSNGKDKDENVLYFRGASKSETLHLLEINEDDEVIERLSQRDPYISVTAFTNKGVVYFGTVEEISLVKSVLEEIKAEIEEENKPQVYISQEDKESGFNFNENDFNIKRNMNDTFDIDKAETFTGEVDEEEQPEEDVDEAVNNSFEEIIVETEEPAPVEQELTAQLIEDIPADDVAEAIVENIPEDVVADETENSVENTEEALTESIVEPVDEAEFENKAVSESQEQLQKILQAIVTPKANTPIVTPNIEVPETSQEIALPKEEEQPVVQENPDAISPDLIINSGGERYIYFGEIDDDYAREGYGRTQMENGRTAYEGNYHKNKRNGFGSFYYRDGGLCYCGEWKENKRNGFGLGLRSSDGSYHAGNWQDNKPEGLGVRFDKYGKLSYVSNFKDGKEKGLAVEFGEDGSISIFRWVNDEKKIIQIIYP
jgi:hypothetical protein